MTVCYFGNFDPEYARNRVMIRGLRENGVNVLICQDRTRGLRKFLNLARAHKKIKKDYDLLAVGYSDSRLMVPLARFLSRKPVIWDAFYSIYDSWVFDRKLTKPGGPKAKFYWFLDWLNCFLADIILLDTNMHIEYFCRTFGVSKKKFIKVLIGADDTIFYPHNNV